MSTTDDVMRGQTDISELWATRVLKRSLFDADGGILGSIVDLILTPEISGNQLSLRGFVAAGEVQDANRVCPRDPKGPSQGPRFVKAIWAGSGTR